MTNQLADQAVGRIIFALSFNKQRLETTFFPADVGIKNVLVSYYYIRGKTEADDIMRRIRKKCDKVFVDSGVFTMNVKFVGDGYTIGSKLGAVSEEAVQKTRSRAMKELPAILKFSKEYVAWLSANDDIYDWCFELDVDHFLGTDVSDRLYAYMKKHLPNPRKILRVWHQERKFSDWEKWCESGEHDYLAIEGGGSHNRDVDFYNKFVEKAHKYNIKVHVLAIADPRFLKQVPVETGDSSSWMAGSRYGYVYTPYGRISYSSQPTKKVNSQMHWSTTPTEVKEKVIKWYESYGINPDPVEMARHWKNRELACIKYFLEQDAPYDSTGKVSRFGIIIE